MACAQRGEFLGHIGRVIPEQLILLVIAIPDAARRLHNDLFATYVF